MEIPDLASALTARQGGASEMELTVVRQMTELLESSVKEMKVSVVWKKNGKEYPYSLTTYMVDYAQSLPTPPPATTPPSASTPPANGKVGP